MSDYKYVSGENIISIDGVFLSEDNVHTNYTVEQFSVLVYPFEVIEHSIR